MRIVGEINQKVKAANLHIITAPRIFVRCVGKACQTLRHCINRQFQCIGKTNCTQCIVNIEFCSTAQGRHKIRHSQNRFDNAVARENHLPIFNECHTTAAHDPDVQNSAIKFKPEPGDVARKLRCSLDQLRVIGVQNQSPTGADCIGQLKLCVRQSCDIHDAIGSQMIGRYVGQQTGVCRRNGQAASHQTATRGFNDCQVNTRVSQRKARTCGA